MALIKTILIISILFLLLNLLPAGAKNDESANSGEDDFFKAVNLMGDMVKFKKMITEKPELLTAVDDYGLSLLYYAVDDGNKDAVEFLIKSHIDVNHKSVYGQTPLFWAAARNRKEIAELLIKNGALTNIEEYGGRESAGETPLHLAVSNGSKELTELLIKNGAKVNSKNKYGDTPLHDAASKGYREIAELLIKSGADINSVNDNGETPLFKAASSGYKEIVKLLISKGADMNIKNDNGLTPLGAAEENKQKEIVELLKTMTIPVSGPVRKIDIKGGIFLMGSSRGNSDEKPVHKVTVSSFYMDKYEVTNKEYCEFLNSRGNQTEGGLVWIELDGFCGIEEVKGTFKVKEGYENFPAADISWYGAVAYCNWLSEKEGMEKCYGEKDKRGNGDIKKKGYRLPTEAEWEYACRSGSKTDYYWGDKIDGAYCWYNGNCTDNPQESGKKKPNGFGLYDMSGNVWEWCNDWYGKDYYGKSPSVNPTGPSSGEFRIMRGGAWDGEAKYCKSFSRSYAWPAFRDRYKFFTGLRIVRTQ